MATITSSPITFLDLTDQQQLSAYLTSNLSTVQFRGTDDITYNPSWEDTPLVITLHAFLNQSEIDYASGDYIFSWYVKDGAHDTYDDNPIQSGTAKTLVIDSNQLGKSKSGMLTYMCEISCNTAETITTEITYTLIGEGKSVVFSVISQDGTIFKNQSGEIKLETIKYYGINEITDNAEFQWYKLTAHGENEIVGAKSDSYIVYGEDVINVASYKCKMTYNGVVYSDIITLQDVSDNYSSDILTIGGTVFKNGVGGSAAYIIVRANSTEEDPLAGVVSVVEPSTPEEGEYWYCVDEANDMIIEKQYVSGKWINVDIPQTLTYSWYLMDQDGSVRNINNNHSKVVYVGCNNIDETTTLCCEVTNGEKLLTISQETFVDLYDSYDVAITPDIAIVMCDNDGNIIQSPEVASDDALLSYEFQYSVKIHDSIIDTTCEVETIDGINIDVSESGRIKMTLDSTFDFGNSDDLSLKVTIITKDKHNFTFERYITFVKVKEGEGAVSFRMHMPQGDTFKEGMDELLLSTVAYKGASAILEASYTWYYYEDGNPDEPHEIYQTDDNGNSSLVTTSYLSVNKSANYAFLTLKCVMEYPKDSGMYYEDYMLLKDYYNPYTASIKFLSQSDVIGVNDLFVVAYAELYKNNTIVDGLPTTAIYYHENTVINSNVITPGGIIETSADGDMKYFVYQTSEDSYAIVLGKYSSSSKSFTVIDHSYNFTYMNSVYPDLHSKIILIPKEDIVDSKEVVFDIYHGTQTYDDDLLIATSNHVVVNLNDKLGKIPQITQDVDEYMNFHPDSGLTISQKYTDGTPAPFYVNITSEKMGFHEISKDNNGQEVDKEVVYIGNNAAHITNLTVVDNADFKTSIDILDPNTSGQTSHPGFSFVIEEDGSLSLVTLMKKEVN